MDDKAVYETLRQELLDSYHRQTNLITFTFTATAAIIGFGFTAENPLVFLLPIIILWLSLMQLNNTMYSVFTISVYIRKSIEAKKEIPRWEQDISAMRFHLRRKKPFEPLRYFNPIISFDAYHYAKAIIVMGAACIALCVWYATVWDLSETEIALSYTASYFGTIFWATRSIKLFAPIEFINSGEFERKLQEEWENIKPVKTKVKKV